MDREKILALLEEVKIIPVAALDTPEDFLEVARALKKGGIPIIEVTFRTDAALKGIELIAKEEPEVTVGAGTVRTIKQIEDAVKAGAKFIVSPGFQAEIVKRTKELGLISCPGIVTPSEIEGALAAGADLLKIFPASSLGGPVHIKNLLGPYKNLKLIPLGGVNAKNAYEYIKAGAIGVGGTWLVDKKVVAEKNWNKITELAKEALKAVRGESSEDQPLFLGIEHVGLNPDGTTAEEIAKFYQNVFGLEVKDGQSSIFVKGPGSGRIEIMKKSLPGKVHLAMLTSDINKAVSLLKQKGYEVDESTRKEKDGKLLVIYLKSLDPAGSAIHLLQA